MKSIIVKLILVVICVFIVVAVMSYGIDNIYDAIVGMTPEVKEKIRIDSISAFDKICSDINDNLKTPVYYINYARIKEEFFKDKYYIDFEVKDDGYSEKMLLKDDKNQQVKECRLPYLYFVWAFESEILKQQKNIKIGNYLISGYGVSGDCALKGIEEHNIKFLDAEEKALSEYLVIEQIGFCEYEDNTQNFDFSCEINKPGHIVCNDFKEMLLDVELFLVNKEEPKKTSVEVTFEKDRNTFQVFFDKTKPFERILLKIHSINEEGLSNVYSLPLSPSTIT